MKNLIVSIYVCVAVIGAILPSNSSAAYWDVTFTAERVGQVGMVDDGENIFQGDPDLFFAMQIEVPGYLETQVFYEGAYVSTTDWNFPDQSVSLSNIYTNSNLPPQVWFSFWLLDDDVPFGDPDLLGVHSFSTNSNIATTNTYNNNINWSFIPDPLAYAGSGWPNNYVLSYNVSFEPVPVPPAVWLFGSGLIGLVGFARRKKA